MDIKFPCTKCGQHLTVDESGTGQIVQCPKCGQSLIIPSLSAEPSHANQPEGETFIVKLLAVLGVLFTLGICVLVYNMEKSSPAATSSGAEAASPPAMATQTTNASGADPLADLRAKAEQGDAKSQYELGRCYANGNGVEWSYIEAVRWYRKAAEQNYADAQNRLGACYAKGEGVAKDEAEAVKWFRKAAAQGHAEAQDRLNAIDAPPAPVAETASAPAMASQTPAPKENNPSSMNTYGLSRQEFEEVCEVARKYGYSIQETVEACKAGRNYGFSVKELAEQYEAARRLGLAK